MYVLDFDGVIYDQFKTKLVYPSAIQVINHLKSEGKKMAIATRRSGPEEVGEMKRILEDAGIAGCFEIIVADSRPKPWHLSQIQEFTKEKELTLYDDFDVNIKDVIAAGYKGVLVNNAHGLTMEIIGCV